ncbi:MAG: hypothetical protein RL385_2193 [Pseudomonadota bacterium]|jgi:mono/diheme cytochrome c family protein
MDSRRSRVAAALICLATEAACDSEAGAPAATQASAVAEQAGTTQGAPAISAGTTPPHDKANDTAAAPADAGAVATGQTTYLEHVQPILARSCLSCHSPGRIAPLSFDSYEKTKGFAPLIARATRARTMPPSVIDNSGACNTFRDVAWLTEDEIATLERWAAQGAPEGTAKAPAPPVADLPKLTGDVRSVTTPAYVPRTAKPDDWRCFVVDSPFKEDTFVTGFDTHPGDIKTSHHMVVFYPMDDASALLARLQDDLEEGPGYTCFGSPGTLATILAAWAPGGGATRYPDNLGIPVQANRPLIIQMHYNTVGTPNPGEDRTKVELEVKKDGVSPAEFANILDLDLKLPPGQKTAEYTFSPKLSANAIAETGSAQVYGVFPHMHELGRSQHLSFTPQGGKETCLVDVPRYDFHWQRMYFFDKPLTLKETDQLKMGCTFDTSSRMTETKWGESTQDEMCVMGLLVKR